MTPSPAARKRRLFTGAMLLIPVLFFALLEGGLRLVGYGDAYPLFVAAENHPNYLYQNRDVARRYFAQQQSVPSSQVDFFRATKDRNTFRIFVQGGSTAAGYPFYHGGSFSRMLEQRLLQTFPGRNIEVVNTSMAAVNSYTLIDLVDEIIAQEPDVVLIYAGHNEYYGALGVGSSESLGPLRFLNRLYLKIDHLRLVQGMRAVLAQAVGFFGGGEQGAVPESTLMERMVGEQSIPYNSALYKQGLGQFRDNLSLLLAEYQQHNVPVFIGTLASNERDHAPFISKPAPATDAEAWQAQFRQARTAVREGDTLSALAALEKIIQLDSVAADAFYEKGRLLDEQRQYPDARTAYVAAKDRDQLRFRAPEAFNRIIREEAARYGATVVETQTALADASRGGIIGDNLMMEHLHPNVDGYFLIADAFYKALREARLIGPWERVVPKEAARREILLTPVDSLVGIFRIKKLVASWPFQPPGVFDRSLDTMQATDPIEEIALKLFRGDTGWREATASLQHYYEEHGNYPRALQAALARIQAYPLLDTPYLEAGNLLVKMGRHEEALGYFQAANDREESAMAQRMIGSIRLQRGQRTNSQDEIQAAIDHLKRAVELDPDNVHALYNLSGAYALTEAYDEARSTAERLLELEPDHRNGRQLLESLPPPS